MRLTTPWHFKCLLQTLVIAVAIGCIGAREPVAAQALAATDATFAFKPPAPVRLAYDVEGLIASSPYTGNAALWWTHDGKAYQSQLLIRKWGLALQTWTSQGKLGERGLEPDTFSSKRLGQAEIHAHFERPLGRIRFTAGTPDAALENGAQDQLSVFMQLASLWAGSKLPEAAGSTIRLQAVGDRYAEQWVFQVGPLETVKLASSSLQALKLAHAPTAERKQKLELWYAPRLQFLPIRIRITEPNGDYLDLTMV
jgi:hypothetical protein